MEFIIDQLVNFWQFTVFGVLVIVGFIINLLGVDQEETLVGLKFKEMPHMKPITIATAGKGFWGAIKMWLLGVRTWEIAKDWNFSLNGENYVIPKGFVFDGASVPKFLASWLSPTGVLLVGGLVHDYVYKYTVLLKKGKKETTSPMSQQEADALFRDIGIEQNGFHFLNKLAYWSLRIGGFVAWNGHRDRNCAPTIK
tara:strand:- start:858 stop:1448 length:591 start_codon:yes stop_codon:yes gene_type:complete